MRSRAASEHRAARARATLVRMGGYARAHRLETSSCAHACAGVVRWSIKVMTESYVNLHAKREIPNWGLVSAQSDGRCEVGIAQVPKVLVSSSSHFPFILVTHSEGKIKSKGPSDRPRLPLAIKGSGFVRARLPTA